MRLHCNQIARNQVHCQDAGVLAFTPQPSALSRRRRLDFHCPDNSVLSLPAGIGPEGPHIKTPASCTYRMLDSPMCCLQDAGVLQLLRWPMSRSQDAGVLAFLVKITSSYFSSSQPALSLALALILCSTLAPIRPPRTPRLISHHTLVLAQKRFSPDTERYLFFGSSAAQGRTLDIGARRFTGARTYFAST